MHGGPGKDEKDVELGDVATSINENPDESGVEGLIVHTDQTQAEVARIRAEKEIEHSTTKTKVIDGLKKTALVILFICMLGKINFSCFYVS